MPSAPHRHRRRALVLLVVGLIGLLMVPVIAIGGAMVQQHDDDTTIVGHTRQERSVPAGHRLRLLLGDDVTVLARSDGARPSCRVTRGADQRVPLTRGGTQVVLRPDGSSYTAAGYFQVARPGSFTFACHGRPALVRVDRVVTRSEQLAHQPGLTSIWVALACAVVSAALLFWAVVELIRARAARRAGTVCDNGADARAYGSSAGERRPTREKQVSWMRPRRRGVALTVIGAVLVVVVAPVVAAAGFFFGVRHGLDTLGSAAAVPSGRSYHLSAGEGVTLFGYLRPSGGGDGVAVGSGTLPAGTCAVTGGGDKVALTHQTGGIEVTTSGSTYTNVASFIAPRSTDYTIRCGDHPALVVGDAQTSDFGRSLAVPIGIGVVVAVLVGLAGIIILVVGIVRLARSRREIREFELQEIADAASGYPPGGWGGVSSDGAQGEPAPPHPQEQRLDDPYRRP